MPSFWLMKIFPSEKVVSTALKKIAPAYKVVSRGQKKEAGAYKVVSTGLKKVVGAYKLVSTGLKKTALLTRYLTCRKAAEPEKKPRFYKAANRAHVIGYSVTFISPTIPL